MVRNNARLSKLHGTHPHGCPSSYLVKEDIGTTIDIFKPGRTDSWPLVDPCFLVPAVISCLRKSNRYHSKLQVVPGEADHFCAADIQRQGGIVITSDSDLLVHNLGEGRVAFFRDLYKDNEYDFSCLSFAPKAMFDTMGLSYPEKPIQLAYELQMAPQATLAQLIGKCSKPVSLSTHYAEFRENYTPPDETILLKPTGAQQISLNNLDPRISEVILAFHSRCCAVDTESPIRVFLPPLMECPSLKSAWDQSSAIRQLAYFIANTYVSHDGAVLNVREFRRVESLLYSGRQVKVPSPTIARGYMQDILSCVEHFEANPQCSGDKFWILLAMALDKIESVKHDRESLVEQIQEYLVSPMSNSGDYAAWGFVHVVAQIQATCYSFRMLQQTLCAISSPKLGEDLPETTKLQDVLAGLLPVERYPCLTDLFQVAGEFQQSGLIDALDEFVVKNSSYNGGSSGPACVDSFGADSLEPATPRKQYTLSNRHETNRFCVLSME